MREMRRLGGSWNATVHAAQRCIETDTAWTDARDAAAGVAPAHGNGPEPLSRYLRRMPGDDCWLSTSTQRRLDTWAAGNVEIEQARETLSRMEERTCGVTLRKIAGERFVVLPAGTLDYPPGPWTGRPALKLSSERGNSMTALERLLIRTLRMLSEQLAGRVPSGFAIEGSVHAL